MKIVVFTNDEHWEILKNTNQTLHWIRVNNIEDFFLEKNADAYFNLFTDSASYNYNHITVPVFINAVAQTLSEIGAAENVIRINAWNGFIEKDYWELAGKITTNANNILNIVQKKFIVQADEIGFITTNTIAMIINEAFIANEDGVSNENDIDIAMKLGTNYPYGPFEWGKKIGFRNIYTLLEKLALSSDRYIPSTSLKAAAL